MRLVILSVAVEHKVGIARLSAPTDIFIPASVRIFRKSRRVALGQDSERSRITHTLGLTALVAVALGPGKRNHLPDADLEPVADLMIDIHPAGISLEI